MSGPQRSTPITFKNGVLIIESATSMAVIPRSNIAYILMVENKIQVVLIRKGTSTGVWTMEVTNAKEQMSGVIDFMKGYTQTLCFK